MKIFAKVLLASGLALTTAFASTSVRAQVVCNIGYHAPAPSRYLKFDVDGRAFIFDRSTGDIFCSGVRIGFRNAAGEVTVFDGALAQVAGAPAPAAGGAVVTGGVAPASGPAPAAGVAAPAVAPAAAPGAPAPIGGSAPTASPAPAGGAAPAGAPAPAGAAPAPVPAPANAAPAPVATANAPAAVPALGSGNDAAAAAATAATGTPAIGPAASINLEMLSGQWRSESKDIAGRTVVRELNFDEEKNATLRVQVQGQEPLSVTGPFAVSGTLLSVTDGDEKRELGQLNTAERDRLVLKGEGETLVFSRPQI